MQEDKNAIYQMRFPQKLWYLLNLGTDAIMWGETGRTILLNYRILHTYLQCDNSIFKTTNISSFVRQLNLYGFRKVTSHLQDPLCNSSNPYMHEYVHDYFQFRKPELLNQITRKALAVKRSFKPKNVFNSDEQLVCLTPLQKARQALRLALKKASQDIFKLNSPKLSDMTFDYDGDNNIDSQDDLGEEEETIDFDWPTKEEPVPPQSPPPAPATPAIDGVPEPAPSTSEAQATFREPSISNQDGLMSFTDSSSPSSNTLFPSQFLSMPDLDNVSTGPRCDMELLAEFNIERDIHQEIIQKQTDESSLNCVLPSIRQHDDESMSEVHNEYNADWEQMFTDIMNNKVPNPDCSSDLKEIYSQISKTIDLLNS